jgi:hypothetical protein
VFAGTYYGAANHRCHILSFFPTHHHTCHTSTPVVLAFQPARHRQCVFAILEPPISGILYVPTPVQWEDIVVVVEVGLDVDVVSSRRPALLAEPKGLLVVR